MEIVILLVPLAFLLVMLAIAAFVWALKKGQFDDLDSPQWRILFDDQQSRPPPVEQDEDSGTTADSEKDRHDVPD